MYTAQRCKTNLRITSREASVTPLQLLWVTHFMAGLNAFKCIN